MTLVEQLVAFVVRASYEELSLAARDQLKIRILDSLGCAIGALKGEPIRLIREHTEDFGGASHCTLIGGGRTAPDRAAFYNSALVRYLDFNDSFLARGETCHPSDNLGSVLAAAEYAGRSGRDLLTALAVAYQVQCRLSEVAPVRTKGFDHTTQGAYAVAAGVSKALGLSEAHTANAHSLKFPNAMPCRIMVHLRDGRTLTKEKQDYEGFHTRPMTWRTVAHKFERLSAVIADAALRKEILDAVASLESIQIVDLTDLLTQVRVVRS